MNRTYKVYPLALVLSLGGCGPRFGDHYSSLSADESPIKVKITQNFGEERVLLASFPSDAGDAEFCELENNICSAPFKMTILGEQKGRYFFALAGMPNHMPGAYQIKIGDVVRTIRFNSNSSKTTPSSKSWKSVFLSGDYIDAGAPVIAWDNARRKIAEQFIERGFDERNVKHLSRNPQIHQANNDINPASSEGIDQAFEELNITTNDSCFLFMTSHGSRSGFHIEGASSISPTRLSGILDKYCGQRPTVAIVSACYSGIMINENTRKANRIIFTASRADKTSNGCQPGVEYTFFDRCIIESLDKQNIATYEDLGRNVKACINRRENTANASFPQFFIGNGMKDLKLGASSTNDVDSSTIPPAPKSINNISGEKNLQLTGVSGNTTLKQVAGEAKYLLIDFSAPYCHYCLSFAQLLQKNPELMGTQCKPVTLVGPDQLTDWVSKLTERGAASEKAHAFSLDIQQGQAATALEGKNAPDRIPTPTILLFDVQKNQVIEKNVGTMTKQNLMGFLGQNCGA
jgi:hypothetical protein